MQLLCAEQRIVYTDTLQQTLCCEQHQVRMASTAGRDLYIRQRRSSGGCVGGSSDESPLNRGCNVQKQQFNPFRPNHQVTGDPTEPPCTCEGASNGGTEI